MLCLMLELKIITHVGEDFVIVAVSTIFFFLIRLSDKTEGRIVAFHCKEVNSIELAGENCFIHKNKKGVQYIFSPCSLSVDLHVSSRL